MCGSVHTKAKVASKTFGTAKEFVACNDCHHVPIAEPSSPVAATQPMKWPWAMASTPIASSESSDWRGGLVRRWCGTSPVMVQPPLDEHYLVIHLGGAKRVNRSLDGPQIRSVVDGNSLTMVPAGTAYRWQTEGPIAFAHVYIPPSRLEAVVGEEFEIEGRSTSFIEKVGCRDALLEPLLLRMLQEIQDARLASTLLLDTLFESVCLQLARQHVSRPARRTSQGLALSPYRLRRVLEFVETSLGEDLALSDLAQVAGASQSHFSRAFRLATGCSPYRYVIRRRIEVAKVHLLTGTDSLDAISATCGFRERHQFNVMFKRIVGVGPHSFRVAHVRK
jgi:AraC family transcriptional regulator